MMCHFGRSFREREPESLSGRGSSASGPLRSGSLYERDFHAWTQEQAARLRADPARFASLDAENLAEEIESLGRSDRRELASRLEILILHLLKWRNQPDGRGGSWRGTIREQRRQIARLLQDSPSLKPTLGKVTMEEYPHAREGAIEETGLPESAFPPACPFTVEDILDPAFLPEAA